MNDMVCQIHIQKKTKEQRFPLNFVHTTFQKLNEAGHVNYVYQLNWTRPLLMALLLVVVLCVQQNFSKDANMLKVVKSKITLSNLPLTSKFRDLSLSLSQRKCLIFIFEHKYILLIMIQSLFNLPEKVTTKCKMTFKKIETFQRRYR